jgi:hypothetical protein
MSALPPTGTVLTTGFHRFVLLHLMKFELLTEYGQVGLQANA